MKPEYRKEVRAVGIKPTWIYKAVAGTMKVTAKVLRKVVTGGKG